jgi:hypothetical protein
MEDFTSPARFFQHGSLNVPWHDDLVMQLIAIDDIGAFAALAFAQPDAYLGRAMEITGDKLTTPLDRRRAEHGGRSPGAAQPRSRSRSPGNTLPRPRRCTPGRTKPTSTPTSRHCGRRSENLMDFDTWLERSGRARLLAQLEAPSA